MFWFRNKLLEAHVYTTSRRRENSETNRTGSLILLELLSRFVMLRGSAGFYTYAVLEHAPGMPDLDIPEARVVFKLQHDKYSP